MWFVLMGDKFILFIRQLFLSYDIIETYLWCMGGLTQAVKLMDEWEWKTREEVVKGPGAISQIVFLYSNLNSGYIYFPLNVYIWNSK